MREGTSVWILPRAPRSQTLLTELQLTRKRNDDGDDDDDDYDDDSCLGFTMTLHSA